MRRLILEKITRKYCTNLVEPNPLEKVEKAYQASKFEEGVIERWKTRRKNESKTGGGHQNIPTFSMILPPPNVTGRLHLGHSLNVAIQDIFARWKTMCGVNVEWIPGFDHAGIATQAVALRKLKDDSNDKEKLMKELNYLAEENREKITGQLKRMGPLLDWDSTYYTMDKNHSEVVEQAFMRLFETGYIKRADGIVNWSFQLGTSISDIELKRVDFQKRITIKVPGYENPVEFGNLYHCAYTLEGSGKRIIVATSRPETMFGDVAVAINPKDSKYSSLIGKRAINPVNGKCLPIIADDRVKIDFGTGVLKITPAHDKVDFAIGKDNNLKPVKVITTKGELSEDCGEFSGMKRYDAREAVIKYLIDTGKLLETNEYSGSIHLCSRSGDVTEPLILPHWYMSTGVLSQKLIHAIEAQKFIIAPDYMRDTLLYDLSKVQDWCLSRQIEWGHSIPAYFHIQYPNDWVVAPDLDTAIEKLQEKLNIEIKNKKFIMKDSDVLDTWFSSSLIPLSLAGWPHKESGKEISLLETGSDILLFWVWRMAIMSIALTGKLPFNNVLLHGIVTDHYGRKMSKSKGNVIDPMDIINGRSIEDLLKESESLMESGELDFNEYKLRVSGLEKEFSKGFTASGTDALRFALLSTDIFRQDIKLNLEYLENCQHFCNKIWQAMKFYLMNSDITGTNQSTIEFNTPNEDDLKLAANRWILASLYTFSVEMEKNLKSCQFQACYDQIRKFFINKFCDVYIELVKSDGKKKISCESHINVMRYVLGSFLKIAHPFIPFVTEQVWYQITEDKLGLLIDQRMLHPEDLSQFANLEIELFMRKGLAILKEIRSMKSKYGVKKDGVFYIETSWVDKKLSEKLEFIGDLCGNKIIFEQPPRLEKHNMLSYQFDLDGKPIRITTTKSGQIIEKSKKAEEHKLEMMKKKLEKIMKQYESPNFQQFAKEETKEKLLKKAETLQLEIDKSSKDLHT